MIDAAIKLLAKATKVVFLTGAGMSADSGLPTYRGVGGLYNDGETEDGFSIEECLSGIMMAAKPEVVWKYLRQIEKNFRDAKPNRGHEVIASIETYFKSVVVVTQNVDGFHQAAGSTDVIDLHGDIHHIYCMKRCGFDREVKNFSDIYHSPFCMKCGGYLRPRGVLFGEMLDPLKVQRYMEVVGEADLIISIGTSALFHYIAEPVYAARNRGVPTIEINPGTSGISRKVSVKITGGAAETLGELWERRAEWVRAHVPEAQVQI